MTKWWVIGAAAFLGTLLITSITFALLSEETVFEPGTPERAVQDLLRAAEDDDIEAAYGMLSEELQEKCTLQGFLDADATSFSLNYEDIRATLLDAKTIGDTTFVGVRITQFYGGGLFDDRGEASYNKRYELRQEGGEWKFTEYPWPYDYCDETE